MESLYTIVTASECTHKACNPTRRSNSGLILLEAINEEQLSHLQSHGYSPADKNTILKSLDIPDWQLEDI